MRKIDEIEKELDSFNIQKSLPFENSIETAKPITKKISKLSTNNLKNNENSNKNKTQLQTQKIKPNLMEELKKLNYNYD